MENPDTWGEAEQVVSEAIQQHEEAIRDQISGISLVARIVDALRVAGLLKEK